MSVTKPVVCLLQLMCTICLLQLTRCLDEMEDFPLDTEDTKNNEAPESTVDDTRYSSFQCQRWFASLIVWPIRFATLWFQCRKRPRYERKSWLGRTDVIKRSDNAIQPDNDNGYEEARCQTKASSGITNHPVYVTESTLDFGYVGAEAADDQVGATKFQFLRPVWK